MSGPADDLWRELQEEDDARATAKAAEPTMSYSPEAEARAIKAATPPRVGAGETYFGHAASSLPLGNRVVDLLTTIFNRDQGVRAELTPQARQELLAMGEEVPPTAPPASIIDDYRHVRDERSERQDYGALQNPWAARLGTATGFGLSLAAPLPAANLGRLAKGANAASTVGRVFANPVGRRLAEGAVTGAGYGALSGATDGKADLTRGEFIQGLADTAGGVLPGAAFGLGGAALGEGVRAAAPWLRRSAVRNAKEAIQGNSDTMAATRKPLEDEAAALMLDEGNIKSFRNVSETADRIIAATDREGEILGRIKDRLESQGFTGPDAHAVAERMMQEYYKKLARSHSNEAPANVFMNEADAITRRLKFSNIDREAKFRADNESIGAPELNSEFYPSNKLGLNQAEDIKSALQEAGAFAKRDAPANVESYRQASRILRSEIEDDLYRQAQRMDEASNDGLRSIGAESEIGDGRHYGQMVDDFIGQKRRTGLHLNAAQFSDRAKSKFDQRPRVGLQDTIAASRQSSTLGQKAMEFVNSQIRARGPSTYANALNSASKGAQSPTASGSFGAAAAQVAPYAMDRTRAWMDEKSLEDLAALPPEELGEYAGPLQAAAARGSDSLKAYDKVLRDTDPKWRELRARLSGSATPRD